MNRMFSAASVFFFCLLCAVPGFSHHSAAAFDRELTVDLQGAVNKIDWTSPHARLYIDAVNEEGETIVWNFELPSPVGLMRRGWTRNSLQAGEVVTVTGYRAKDHAYIAIATTVKNLEGQDIFAGSAPRE